MTTNITILLIGLTVWAAFNATMFYCINSTVFAPNMGLSPDGETWRGKPSTLLTAHKAVLAALFFVTSLLVSFDGTQMVSFFPSLLSVVLLTDENPGSDEPATWKDVNNSLKLTFVAVVIGAWRSNVWDRCRYPWVYWRVCLTRRCEREIFSLLEADCHLSCGGIEWYALICKT